MIAGLYFNPALLKPALKTNQSRFLVKSVLQSYFDFGGEPSLPRLWILDSCNPKC